MALTTRETEIVAVAISVAAGCRPCTTYHLGEARRAGASDADIEKAVAGAVCVRTSATEGMRRHALGLEPAQDGCGCAATEGLAELVAIGASLAVNCTANLDKHLIAARALGVPAEDIDAVAALVEKVRPHAIRHARARLPGAAPHAATSNTATPASAGCGAGMAAAAGCC